MKCKTTVDELKFRQYTQTYSRLGQSAKGIAGHFTDGCTSSRPINSINALKGLYCLSILTLTGDWVTGMAASLMLCSTIAKKVILGGPGLTCTSNSGKIGHIGT